MATDLHAVIEDAVRAALAPMPVGAVDVEERPDHAEEEALFITVTLPPAPPLVGGRRYMATMASISDALLDRGDRRIPHVRLDHTGEEAPDETGRTEAAAS